MLPLKISLYAIVSVLIWFLIGAIIGYIFNREGTKLFGRFLILGGLTTIISEFFICRDVCMGDRCLTIWHPGCMSVYTILGLIMAGIGGIILWKIKNSSHKIINKIRSQYIKKINH